MERRCEWGKYVVTTTATENKVDFGSWWCCLDEIQITQGAGAGPIGDRTRDHQQHFTALHKRKALKHLSNFAVNKAISHAVAFQYFLCTIRPISPSYSQGFE